MQKAILTRMGDGERRIDCFFYDSPHSDRIPNVIFISRISYIPAER